MDYNYSEVEKKWQNFWKENDIYKVKIDPAKPKYYVLDMFPYPSGSGLHVGHPLGYIASDIFSRYKRLKGYNVLHPMGFDAFGLPAEQYAIQTGKHPALTTAENIARFKQQMKSMGFCYDWSREVTTSDPKYYKWTQWIFLQLFKSWYNIRTQKAEPVADLISTFEKEGNVNVEGAGTQKDIFTAKEWKDKTEKEQQEILMNYRLAYLANSDVNWCPELGTVLANDEVKDGVSERGGHPVVKKTMRQWYLRITAYAERLLNDLEKLDWTDSLKEMQRNWIGRSEGAAVFFLIADSDESIEIFTTRPDTIFGATFMVLAPEHPLVEQLTTAEQKADIDKYQEYMQSRSELERQAEVKKVTGAFTGSYAVNPLTDEKIPIWVAEYVLMGYGTGAIMAVPSDDDRDNAFAEEFGLPIIDVIDKSDYPDAGRDDKVGKMINSGFITGMKVPDAIQATITKVEEMGIGKRQVNYRLRDAGFSRQRYWGEPFPIVYKDDMPYAIDESELPLLLPKMESFKPTGTGESPLALLEEWVNAPEGKRETDTMPGYAGSSWYFLRYMDSHNEDYFISKEAEEYWQDVDLYIGGTEHAVGHLMYSRFWNKFFFDQGWVSKKEPFKKLVNQGMIQGISPRVHVCQVQGKPYYISYDDIDFENKTVRLNGKWAKVDNGIIGWSRQGYDLVTIEGDQFRIYKKTLSKKYGTGESLVTLNPDHPYILWKVDENSEKYIVAGFEIEKMSKSRYNVVNPDDIIKKYGADTFRLYEMFLGPIEQSKPWNTQGIDGVFKFIRKFWRLFYDGHGKFLITDNTPSEDEFKILHKTIKKIQDDIERYSFNTCVSAFMICVNKLTDLKCHKREILQDLVVLMASFAPHIAEELWEALGQAGSVTNATFPGLNEKYLLENTYTYPVSINGKRRAEVELSLDLQQSAVEEEILALDNIVKWLDGKPPKKVIYVPGRIINVVV